MIHLVTLNPSIDTKIFVDNMTGRDCLAQKVEYFLAGKAINVGKALSFNDVEFHSHVFSGELPVNGLSLEGHDFFYHTGVARQNFTIYDHDGLVVHIRSNATACSSALQAFIKKIAVNVVSEDYLIVAGSVPSLLEDPRSQPLSSLLSKIACNIIVDTAAFGMLELEKLSPHTLKINSKELASVLNIPSGKIDEQALVKLQMTLGGRVIVTQGAGRVMTVDADGFFCEYELPEMHVSKSASEIGSGDVFLGGYLTSLYRGNEFSCSVRLAMAYGAIHQGMNLLFEADFDSKYAGEIADSVRVC